MSPDPARLLAAYRVRGCTDATIGARAQALALEQSVEMPLEAVRDARVLEAVVGRVAAIEPLADGHRVTLALAAETVTGAAGADAGQLMNMLFGNCSLQPDVELVDLALPDALLAAHPGPAFGLAGWREATGVRQGALACTALKPQGLPPQALAELAGLLADAGLHVIKDDHGIADQLAAPFHRRVPAVQRAIERANARRRDAQGDTATRTVYAPTLSGGPARIAEQLRIVRDEGVGAVLACPMLMGLPVFAELVRPLAGVPILAHPAFAGGRIAPPLLLATLFRLLGADATIFPNYGGRFAYDRATCESIVARARAPLGPHRAVLPVPAGGMSVARVDEMRAVFGDDTMLLIGGNLLQAGDAMAQRAAEFARCVGAHDGTRP